MPFSDWREPARLLAVSYGPPTEAQVALATHAQLDLPEGTPHDVAAALLADALAPTLTQPGPAAPTTRQLAHLHALGYAWRSAPWKATRRVAAALIVVHVSRRRVQTLLTLRPAHGDLVGVVRPHRHDPDPDSMDAPSERRLLPPLPPSLVVSSVSAGGRVNFRGGPGMTAWPEDVTMLARAADVWTSPAGDWSQPTLFDR